MGVAALRNGSAGAGVGEMNAVSLLSVLIQQKQTTAM
jgi:hypothetical protein